MDKRICITGGIACGKSQLAKCLNRLGVETLDADDIVHRLIPDDERRELAAKVFADPALRKQLEARIHPLVEQTFETWFAEEKPGLKVAIIPLLFEVHWDGKYDKICCVICEESRQIARMMQKRGYTRDEAERRLAAQMPASEKAAKSHYVIRNDGSIEELEQAAARFVAWLTEKEVKNDE